MTKDEAIKTGLPFRRPSWKDQIANGWRIRNNYNYEILWYGRLTSIYNKPIFTKEDESANDYETKPHDI